MTLAAESIEDADLAVLRMALLRAWNVRSIEEFADCVGLPVEDTVRATGRVASIGLIMWSGEGECDLRPRLEHPLWPQLAERVTERPIWWPESRHVVHDPQSVRRELDTFLPMVLS